MRIADATVLAVLTLASCRREERPLHSPPPAPPASVVVSELQPGPTVVTDTAAGVFDDNAYGISEGQRLFAQMNCSGCHSHGGGGMGPALMDSVWIYGSRPEQIFATIAQGRPNGMPAFGLRLNSQEIWQLAAYVRSLSALTPRSARPGRDDHMQVSPSPQQTEPHTPVTSSPARPPAD